MSKKITFAIIGAGAMGCRFGAQLLEAGFDVTLYDVWKEHIEAIQNHGLIVKRGEEEKVIKIEAYVDPLKDKTYNVLIVFTKAQYTEEALNKYSALISQETYILTLQNGLGNKESIANYVSMDRIIVGTTTYSSDLFKPGVIEVGGSGETLITNLRGTSFVVSKIEEALNKAFLNTRISKNTMIAIWEKLAFNAAINSVTALTGLTTGHVGNHPLGIHLLRKIVEEVAVVARYLDIVIDTESVVNTLLEISAPDKAGNHYPSMAQDIVKKKKTEIEAINGAIIREAEKCKISVPYNQSVYSMIKMIEDNYMPNQTNKFQQKILF
ncbi:2-dehydropantoate 2-reductase [Cytobacillus depressus]|uniref:2-dehydropantoate 2-reductase n=1 Tax=Cytobacillus depressus TaxID=1602942 RepID=A0A6L3V218_9BACI|nr:2-dehydropantoate 2-reductase [Cytobacillus depressus]KAB2330482.1 2-dehydropantoate 2-reductase [Cytobacillus depressus]